MSAGDQHLAATPGALAAAVALRTTLCVAARNNKRPDAQ